MRIFAITFALIAIMFGQLQSALAQTETGYVGRNGLFLVSQTQSGASTGFAALRLPDASASNTVKLVGMALTEDVHDARVRAYGWPREHRGTIFRTGLDTAKYPEYVFLAYDDAASSGEPYPWIYPAAYKRGGTWYTLHLFAKTPLDMTISGRLLSEQGSRKPAGSYSGPEGQTGYGIEEPTSGRQ
jgi:hypothetical protein